MIDGDIKLANSSTLDQKEKIEETDQAIFDACERYPEASLADLYDELTMPFEDEPACVAYLMKLYLRLTTKDKTK